MWRWNCLSFLVSSAGWRGGSGRTTRSWFRAWHPADRDQKTGWTAKTGLFLWCLHTTYNLTDPVHGISPLWRSVRLVQMVKHLVKCILLKTLRYSIVRDGRNLIWNYDTTEKMALLTLSLSLAHWIERWLVFRRSWVRIPWGLKFLFLSHARDGMTIPSFSSSNLLVYRTIRMTRTVVETKTYRLYR